MPPTHDVTVTDGGGKQTTLQEDDSKNLYKDGKIVGSVNGDGHVVLNSDDEQINVFGEYGGRGIGPESVHNADGTVTLTHSSVSTS
jgi:hypothetical protein